jgi:hypothetical protein
MRISRGDDFWTSAWDVSVRGPFVCSTRLGASFEIVTDGLSNTIFFSESAIGEPSERNIRRGIANSSATAGPTNPPELRMNAVAGFRGAGGEYNEDVVVATNGGASTNANYEYSQDEFSGARWADAGVHYSGFNLVLPPNGPSAANGGNASMRGISTASSYHPGGVVVAMGDAATRFISDTIDAGTAVGTEKFGPSPFGAWGAIGSRNGGESVSL